MKKYFESLLSFIKKSPILAVCITAVFIFVFAYSISSIKSSLEMRSERKAYQAKIDALNKSLQQALIQSQKHDELSKAYEEEARSLQRLNDAKAANLIKTDDALVRQSNELEERRKTENETIQRKYNEEITASTFMSDDDRASDICSRLKKLSTTNPEFAKFKCPD